MLQRYAPLPRFWARNAVFFNRLVTGGGKLVLSRVGGVASYANSKNAMLKKNLKKHTKKDKKLFFY
jgi:hypothetical protein